MELKPFQDHQAHPRTSKSSDNFWGSGTDIPDSNSGKVLGTEDNMVGDIGAAVGRGPDRTGTELVVSRPIEEVRLRVAPKIGTVGTVVEPEAGYW